MYSAILNAQTNDDRSGNQDTSTGGSVLVITKDGRKKIPSKDISPALVSELKISNARLMPKLTWESMLDVMHLIYKPSKDLVLNEKFEFCKPYSLSLHNSVKSRDGNFLTYVEHYHTGMAPIFTNDTNTPDSVASAYNRYFNNIMNIYAGTKNDYLTRISVKERNMRHISIIRDHLIDIAGKFDTDSRYNFPMKDLKKHVHYQPNEYAKSHFNADTVIQYSLPVKPVNGNKKFQKKYSYCEVLLLQKNDLGPVILYCFFTKEGYKKRKKYMSELEKTLGFQN